LATIIQKRRALHNDLNVKQKENRNLKLQLGQMQALANIGINTSMIAHEINNLLTPLTNYAELAIRNPEDEALTEKVLNKTLKNCQRAAMVMQTILAMGKKNSEEKSNVNLRTLIDEIFISLCRDFKKDQITVDINIPDGLHINAVAIQIQQTLMNLILNARDAMLDNGGYLKIAATQNKNSVSITVSDTGCGINKKDLRDIFEPFFTTKTDSDTNTSGTGLGLAFCKKIIESHNGSISVESSPQKGTTFDITLPNEK